MKILIICLLLCSCAIVDYEGKSDGSTKVNIYTLGSDKALQDFSASVIPNGERKFIIGKYTENQTNGMKQANQGLQMLMEGLAKGTVEGIK